MPDPQVGKSDVGPRTFLTVWEFVWHNCSTVCGLSARHLYGGVNGDLLHEGLCHTQECCTQSPCPCGRPLLTRNSTGDIQILNGMLGSVSVRSPVAQKALFEPSDHLWWVQGLILFVIFPAYHLAGVSSLPLDIGYLFLVGSYFLLLMVV